MPNWSNILDQIQIKKTQNPVDMLRHKYLDIMHQYTHRNIIAYYSGWLQKSSGPVAIDDNDKNAFMQAVHQLDKSKGLDLLLHTPGGNLAATESIVNYLKQIFGNDIRAFVPQIAMSAGTMIALSCKEIVLGKQSNIGPIDPQYGLVSCAAVVEEFKQALADITQNSQAMLVWRPILEQYHPTYIGECQKGIEWADRMVKQWLIENMLSDREDKEQKADAIASALGNHSETKTHARHIHIDECESMGIKVQHLETLMPGIVIDDCNDLQDCVLTIHHTYMHTFASTTAIKIVENHLGKAMITMHGSK